MYANEGIAAGAVIVPKWNEGFYRSMEGWVRLSTDEIERLPAAQRDLFLRYGMDEDFGFIAGPLDEKYVHTPDNYVNHSCSPNLRYDTLGNVVAARDVRKDEELRIDYGCFTVNFDEEFECACGAAECRGRVTKDDWKILARKYGYAMPRFLHGRIAAILESVPEAAVPLRAGTSG